MSKRENVMCFLALGLKRVCEDLEIENWCHYSVLIFKINLASVCLIQAKADKSLMNNGLNIYVYGAGSVVAFSLTSRGRSPGTRATFMKASTFSPSLRCSSSTWAA